MTVVWICISSMMSKIEHLLIGLRDICISFLWPVYICSSFFYMVNWGFFSSFIFRSSLFICLWHKVQIFFPNESFALLIFLHAKSILFSCALIYRSFILLVLDSESRSFLQFEAKKGIRSRFLLELHTIFLMIFTFSLIVPSNI